MIKVNSMSRGSGKTTKAIEKVLSDENSILVVHSKLFKQHLPKELRDTNRVLSLFELEEVMKSGRLKGVGTRLVIDDAFLMGEENLAEFCYLLGQIGIPVEIFGTTRVDEMTAFNELLKEEDKNKEDKLFNIDVRVWKEVIAPMLLLTDGKSHLKIVTSGSARTAADVFYKENIDSVVFRDYQSKSCMVELSNGEKTTFIENKDIYDNDRGCRFSSIGVIK